MVTNGILVETAETGTAFAYKAPLTDDDRRYCKCGCNQQVVGKKLYRPGHDARHVAQLVAAVVAVTTPAKQRKAVAAALAALSGSPRLQLKLVNRLGTLGVEVDFEPEAEEGEE